MALKRVLIAYSRRPPIIEYLKRGFGSIGVEAEGFYADDNTLFDRYVIHHVNKTGHNLRILPKSKNLFTAHPLAHLNYRCAGLLKKAREFQPDLVLIVRGIKFTDEVYKALREQGTLFGWWIEKEERMNEAFREAGFFDHYFFMNSSCVDEGKQRGFGNISLLHHSVDPSVFRPLDLPKVYDWAFVGAWSEKRQGFIEEALKVSPNGAIWGPKWTKKNPFNMRIIRAHKGRYIEGEALVRLYAETRVVVNITNWGRGEGDKRSGMNMRVLEVPACGAFLLTDGSRDLKSMVTPGVDVVIYEGLDEFASKLSYYLKEDGEREKIASQGRKHVAGSYTYGNVARIIAAQFEAVNRDRDNRQGHGRERLE